MVKSHSSNETLQQETLGVYLTIWLREGVDEKICDQVLVLGDLQEVLTIEEHAHIVDVVLKNIYE